MRWDVRSAKIMQEVNNQISPVWWNNKNIFIFFLIACGAIQAFVFHYGNLIDLSEDQLDIVMGFILNFIMLGWCSIDAQEKTVRISGLLRFALFVISLIGVPWYFIRSRGLVGALKNGFGFGLFIIWLASLIVGLFFISVLQLIQAH
jgi:hypothetical protein